MNSKNYKNQENIVENAFFTKINTFLKLGMIPKELAEVEISPVDYTALAIVKLFNKVELSNQTYHLFNPYPANLIKLLSKNKNVNIKIATFNQFIDAILLYLSQHDNSEQIELFMLHQLWLQDINLEHLTTIDILQDKTSYILSQLNFSWPYITTDMLSNITNAFLKDGQRG
jgi:surfactin family lipopeptide synthetase A